MCEKIQNHFHSSRLPNSFKSFNHHHTVAANDLQDKLSFLSWDCKDERKDWWYFQVAWRKANWCFKALIPCMRNRRPEIQTWCTYNHAYLSGVIAINLQCVVQHQIHELVKSPQDPDNIPICIQLYCNHHSSQTKYETFQYSSQVE